MQLQTPSLMGPVRERERSHVTRTSQPRIVRVVLHSITLGLGRRSQLFSSVTYFLHPSYKLPSLASSSVCVLIIGSFEMFAVVLVG